MNILTALKRSSLGLDLYLWLTYRTFALQRPLRLSWKALYRQFGATGALVGGWACSLSHRSPLTGVGCGVGVAHRWDCRVGGSASFGSPFVVVSRTL